MAQLLKINDITKREYNNIGDIVGIFEDSHIFDDNEKIQFDIEKLPGTRFQVIIQMTSYIPEKKIYYKNSMTGEYEEMKEEPKYQVCRKDGQFVDNTLELNMAAKSG